MAKKMIELDGETLTIEDVISVARRNHTVKLSSRARKNIQRAAELVKVWVDSGETIYGVTTGFGPLSDVLIPSTKARELQRNLLISHAAGVGAPFSTEIVRAAMLLRANTLAKGYSGIRLETLQLVIDFLNKGVHPQIPEKGSVGASGDLAPLSHMALVLIGEGRAEYKGKILSGAKALKQANLKPITLEHKEGIALVNGTQIMTAIAALAVADAQNLIISAEIAAALSIEALEGIMDAFDARIQSLRPHPGQQVTAKNLSSLLEGSSLVLPSHKAHHVQDAYSLRCTPQVLGAVRDAISYCERVVTTEINSATDNPLIFPESKIYLSGGNFHGQPIAIAMDFLATALTSVGIIADRRIARLIDNQLSHGLPLLLLQPSQENRGVYYGLGLAQITAAALAAECQTLATPASVTSIPTSANQEDHVSMGTIAARQTREIISNIEHITAIELLCATQGIDFRKLQKKVELGQGTKLAYDFVRLSVPRLLTSETEQLDRLTQDTLVHRDIVILNELVHSRKLRDYVQSRIPHLKIT